MENPVDCLPGHGGLVGSPILEEKGEAVNRDEFEYQYAKRSGITVERLHTLGKMAYPCRCGYDECQGWAMLTNEQALSEVELGRITQEEYELVQGEKMSQVSLFQSGDFTLHSGKKSNFKINCDSLTDADWDCLAVMVRKLVGPYKSVQGIPKGGLKLEERLKLHCSSMGPHLIVDDVLTTGGSMETARDEYLSTMPTKVISTTSVVGCVVFCRGLLPLWVKVIFRMPGVLWL